MNIFLIRIFSKMTYNNISHHIKDIILSSGQQKST